MRNLLKISCILCLGFAVGNLSAQTDSNFSFTGAEQTWTVPCGVTQLSVIAVGGAGGGSTANGTIGGTGATITGVVPVTPGDVIDIYVGGTGVSNINDDGGAGGGGTFIYDSTAGKLLEVAGGGGGSYYEFSNGFNASVDTVPTGTNGGVGQGGGRATRIDAGGGGASFINNGATNGNSQAGTGGYDRANGFAGGAGDIEYDPTVIGGYGGGGGGGDDGGGGGGGYNGGGVDTVNNEPGGGGSSYVIANDTLSTMDTNTGNGITTFIYFDTAIYRATGNVVSNVSCNGGSNGSASAINSAGKSPFTYSWTPGGESSDTATGLSAGSYTVNVTDACGSTASATVTLTQPNTALTAATTMPMNLTCNGASNGSDTAIAAGGTGPYTYSWMPSGGTDSTGTGLTAGSYTLTITDNNGCTASASATITQPNALTATMSMPMNVSCNGNSNGKDTAIAAGGTMPYTYSWAPSGGTGAIGTGLSAGSYTVTVKDGCGATATSSVTITQPAAMVVTIDSVNNSDTLTCNGSASVSVAGGTAPYTYSWTGGGTSDSIAGKCSGYYCCTVTDKNGCADTACIHIGNVTGIANISAGEGEITVYPNPTNGQFTMRLPSTGQQLSVEIYNVLGEKVYSQFNIQNPAFNINLGNQPNGIYLYRVISGNGTLIGQGKIMLQK